jgi:hypothetical protein
LAALAGAICCVSSLAVLGAASAQATPTASGSSVSANPWGKPIEIPGIGALEKGGGSFTNSISCVSPGNCAAAGSYADAPDGTQGFVVSESKGHWGKAIAVPGLVALDKAREVETIMISCGTAGNCAAGGTFLDAKDNEHAFVASENNGTWGKAIEVPGVNALKTGRDAELTSLACSPGRDCSAGGTYDTNPSGVGSFVVSERNGRWGKATAVRGLNPSQFARLRTLSCASAGNCSAGGSFTAASNLAGWVVSEKNSVWGKAIEVPGLSTLSASGDSETNQMSCASAGNCTAGGIYADSSDNEQAFVVSEKNGTWGKAVPVPGLATLNAGDIADVQSISCASPGNCAVGGTYKTAAFLFQGYVVSQKNGTWGNAIEIANLGTLNKGGNVDTVKVGCVSAGNCVAGGEYLTAPGEDSATRAFMASENKGAWGKATQLPGLSTLNHGSSVINAISCTQSGRCAADGTYEARSGAEQGFVVSQK